jgi:transmembrane sensor
MVKRAQSIKEKAIEAEAAVWLARLQTDNASDAVQAGLRAWIAEDEAHGPAFERATWLWEMLPSIVEQSAISKEEQARSSWRRGAVAALAACLLVILSGIAYQILAIRPVIYQTGVGQQQSVLLEDGSRISLNTDSKVEVKFSRRERHVVLARGEAMFEVSKNPQKPFVVQAGHQLIRVLGTTFAVRQHEASTLEVTLLQGRVEVQHEGQAHSSPIAVLKPGQRLMLTSAGAAIDYPQLDEIISWRKGEVVFDNASLLDAAAEMNRYDNSHTIVIDPPVASLRISGVFAIHDLFEFAKAVGAVHNLQVQTVGQEIHFAPRISEPHVNNAPQAAYLALHT